MSIRSTSPQAIAKQSKTTRNWVALSFIFSMALIGWAFAVGRRAPDQSLVSSSAVTQSLAQLDLPEEFVIGGDTAEEIRAAMLAADHELMRSLAKRRAAGTARAPRGQRGGGAALFGA